MTLSIVQSATALAPRCPASFLGVGSTGPYTYSVQANGAGGTINPSTGAYTAPADFKSNPITNIDTIIVMDSLGNSATAQILIGSYLLLFCDIVSHELGIPRDRVYLWDQKIMQPTDFGMYVAVSVGRAKPFGNVYRFNSTTNTNDQFVAMQAMLDIDVISRGPDARDRKEEVILALASQYSQQQQTTNGFYIGTISKEFVNLSYVDGAAIPYRYRISVNMQYPYRKISSSQYFDTFTLDEIATNA